MFGNYMKIAWRNLLRNKTYSLINIIGLAIGICSCLLIYLYIHDELRYDKEWENSDRIVRVNQIFIDKEVIDPYAATSFNLGPLLKDNLPEIESVVRIDAQNHRTVSYKDKYFNIDKQYYVDDNIFNVFDFKLSKGDSKTCLKEPFSVVISEDMAKKYFGTEDPIGKTLQYPTRLFTVTGVLKNDFKSHLNPNALLSVKAWREKRDYSSDEWFNLRVFTYVKLKENISLKTFEDKLRLLSSRVLDPIVKEKQFSFKAEFVCQPLSDVYFDKVYAFDQFDKGEGKFIPMFGWIAFFILIIACFNYMNLATARAVKRSKEVGLRKVIGAGNRQLIVQFMGESFLLSIISIIFSLILLAALLPVFNSISGKQLEAIVVLSEFNFWAAIAIIMLFVGIVGGSYPALYLTKFKPVEVLKSKVQNVKRVFWVSSIRIRQTLVVSQFTISIVIIIATILVNKQLQFMKNKDLGFNIDKVVVLKLPSYMDSTKFSKIEPFKNKLLMNSLVSKYSTTEQFVGSSRVDYFLREGESKKSVTMNINWCDYDYLDLLNVKLVKGRNFSKEISSDGENYIINESAARFLNWNEPLGKELSLDGKTFGKVIGIVKNYNYKSPQFNIEPMALALVKERNTTGSIILLKIPDGVKTNESLTYIDKTWNEFFPKNPISRSFLDEKYEEQYHKNQTMFNLFTAFSGLTIIISCLGLIGLTAYTTEQRIKEVGIRKVLGATVTNITLLISKDFILLVLIAVILASPIAYHLLNIWLQDFSYKTTIDFSIFLISGGIALFIAFFSVSYQTIKSAMSNPIKSLRSE